jgi:hypothetical protein
MLLLLDRVSVFVEVELHRKDFPEVRMSLLDLVSRILYKTEALFPSTVEFTTLIRQREEVSTA